MNWIFAKDKLPPQPEENPLLDYKPLELYLVVVDVDDYPFRAFWNGEAFVDGWGVLNVVAWMPLPKPPKGEIE